ncbi:MAG TPA: HAMP domain-containing protein, partial [Roseiflexaceae bacterium]|nr:HAMP domain-containing protein [Roseiflexaceae bacterium]
VAVVAAATLWGIFSLRASARQAVEVDGYLSRLSSDVSIKTLQCRRYEKDFFLTLSDEKTRNEYLAKWNNGFAGLNQAIGGFDAAAAKPEDKQLAADWRTDSAAYQAAFLAVVMQIERGEITTPSQANLALAPSKDSIRRLTDTATETAVRNEAAAQRASVTLQEDSVQTTWMVVLLVLLAMIAAVVWSLLFPSRLMRPVTALQLASSRIASGDLTARVDMVRNDELGILARTFNHMTDTIRRQVDDLQNSNEEIQRLQEAEANKRRRLLEQAVGEYMRFAQQVAKGDLTRRIETEYDGALGQLGEGLNSMVTSLHDITLQVQEATTSIAAATNQILAATTEQAASSAEQSAAITETATSVEEVKVIAQQTADQATWLASESQTALEIARQGDQAIEATIAGMTEVRQQVQVIGQGIQTLGGHSQAIGATIATLSELADQITGLAQNAAIESTRSGAQGADLSELARLVRGLSERAKTATGEVRERLSSIQQATAIAVQGADQGGAEVEAGAQLVTEAGTTIRRLTAEVQHGAQANMQMAAAAQQQMIGMEQIGQAMSAIQQATTQALAGTQQAEQAAQDLYALAQSLQRAIATYRL